MKVRPEVVLVGWSGGLSERVSAVISAVVSQGVGVCGHQIMSVCSVFLYF